MATKNLVPRADNEGNLGVSTRRWAGGYFVIGAYDDLQIKHAKSSSGTDLIVPEAGSSITVTKSDDGQFIIGGGGGSGTGEKIIKDNTSVSIIDDTSNPGKIEFKVDSALKWTLDGDAFIPESGLDIGSNTKGLEKLYIDGTSGLVYIGTSQLKLDSNKLQLSNNSGTDFYDLATTNDLSNYVQVGSETSQNLQSVLTAGSTATTSATIKDVIIGSNSKEITLNKLVSANNESISIVPNGTGVTQIGGTIPGTNSVDIKQGQISVKSDTTGPAYIDLYNKPNNFYTRLEGADLTANKSLTLPIPTGSNGTLALQSEVNAIASGIKAQQAVRVATTANGTLASAYANGQTVDGVTLATNDRILLKDQSTGSENGIYIVQASGAPTRATDFASNAQVAGYFVFVQEGTVNQDTGWLCTNDAANDTVGTDALVFSQFTSAGQTIAGTGLTKTVNTLSVNAAQTQITSVGTLNNLSVSGTSTFSDDITLQNEKKLTFMEGGGTSEHGISVKSPNAISDDYTLTLPISAGNDGQVLKTNGSGVLSWVNQSSGGLSSVSEDPAPTLGGNLTIGAHKITGNLIPNINNGRDLGDDNLRWRDLYTSRDIFYNNNLKTSADGYGLSLKKSTNNSTDIVSLNIETPVLSTNPAELKLTHLNGSSVNNRVINKISMIKSTGSTREKASIDLKTSTNSSGFELNFNLRGSDGIDPRITIDTTSNNDRKIQFWLPTEIRGQYPIRFYENASKGTNYAAIRGPNNASANYTITLPNKGPSSNGQILADTDGTGTLEWVTKPTFNLKNVSDQLPTGTVDSNNPSISKIQSLDRLLVMDDSDSSDKNTYIEFKDLLFNIYGSNPEITGHGPNIDSNSQVLLKYIPHTNTLTTTIKDDSVTKANLEKIGTTKVLGNISKLTNASASDTDAVTEIEVSKEITENGSSNHTTLVTQKGILDYIESVLPGTVVENPTIYYLNNTNTIANLSDDAYGKKTIIELSSDASLNKPLIIRMPSATNLSRINTKVEIEIRKSSSYVATSDFRIRGPFVIPHISDPQLWDLHSYGTHANNGVFNFTSSNDPFAVTTNAFSNLAFQDFRTTVNSSSGGPFTLTEINGPLDLFNSAPTSGIRINNAIQLLVLNSNTGTVNYTLVLRRYTNSATHNSSSTLIRNTGNTNNIDSNTGKVTVSAHHKWELV